MQCWNTRCHLLLFDYHGQINWRWNKLDYTWTLVSSLEAFRTPLFASRESHERVSSNCICHHNIFLLVKLGQFLTDDVQLVPFQLRHVKSKASRGWDMGTLISFFGDILHLYIIRDDNFLPGFGVPRKKFKMVRLWRFLRIKSGTGTRMLFSSPNSSRDIRK